MKHLLPSLFVWSALALDVAAAAPARPLYEPEQPPKAPVAVRYAFSMTNATFTFTWYSVIFPSFTTAELFRTSRPVICRTVSDARATAC